MDTTRKVLILGATTNPERYAYKAAERLTNKGFPIVPVGIRKGILFGKEISIVKTPPENIDTITLYVGQKNQEEWIDFILKTNPKRVIFNPGTENKRLQEKLEKAGIQSEEACTLVLLGLNTF